MTFAVVVVFARFCVVCVLEIMINAKCVVTDVCKYYSSSSLVSLYRIAHIEAFMCCVCARVSQFPPTQSMYFLNSEHTVCDRITAKLISLQECLELDFELYSISYSW